MGDDGERLPRSHSEWCILRRADISVLSQAESCVLRLIQNLRGHLQNNVAFKWIQDLFNETPLVYRTGYTYIPGGAIRLQDDTKFDIFHFNDNRLSGLERILREDRIECTFAKISRQ